MADSGDLCEPRKRLRIGGRDLAAALIIVALALLAMLPIFLRHFPKGHDAAWHYRWAVGFANAISEGALYPRWHAEANFGQGSPVLLYYPPLSFYAVAAFSAIVREPIVAIKLACFLALSLSGLTMYAFGRSFFPRGACVLAAAFYVLSPYHMFDLYTRSALSEFWAFAWVPLLLHAARRACLRGELRAVPPLAISYALLLLTNVPIFFAATLILPVYALCLTRDGRRLIRLASGLMLGLGLAAIYAIPVVFERRYVNIGRILGVSKDFFLFRNFGFVFDAPVAAPGEGPELFLTNSNWIALSLLLLFVTASLPLWNGRRLSDEVGLDDQSRRAVQVMTAVGLLMTTVISLPLWRVIPGFSILQFPTRWLLIVSAGVSVTVAASASAPARSGKLRFIRLGVLAAAVGFALVVSTLTVARTPLDERWYKGRQLSNIETREYHPVWWDGQPHEEFEATPVIVSRGDAAISAIDDAGVRQSYVVSASTESVLRFRTLFFPGWVARSDGRPITTRPGKEGNLELTVEPGEHNLTLSLEDTWPRLAGKAVSACCFMIWVAILLLPFHRRRLLIKRAEM